MLECSVQFLKKNFPNADIEVAYSTVQEARYFNGINLDEVVLSEWGHVIDVSSCCVFYERPGSPVKNRIDIYKDKLGCPEVEWPRIRMSPVYVPQDFVALHVNSLDSNRSWSEDNYLKLIRRFPKRTFVVLDEQYTLEQLAFIINESKLFLGPDSFPMHLAGFLRKRSLVLFGPSVPEARLNHYPTHEALCDEDCNHCWHQECLLKRNCINRIRVDTVSARLEQVLAEI